MDCYALSLGPPVQCTRKAAWTLPLARAREGKSERAALPPSPAYGKVRAKLQNTAHRVIYMARDVTWACGMRMKLMLTVASSALGDQAERRISVRDRRIPELAMEIGPLLLLFACMTVSRRLGR